MKQVDELIFDAITSDAELMEIIGGRVTSTVFEIPPGQNDDNTPVPNIIIIDEGFNHNITTKDCVWEGAEDQVQVTVDIAGKDPDQVKIIMRKVRKVVEQHMASLGADMPQLVSLQAGRLEWDWMKPCYFKPLIYQCTVKADIDD